MDFPISIILALLLMQNKLRGESRIMLGSALQKGKPKASEPCVCFLIQLGKHGIGVALFSLFVQWYSFAHNTTPWRSSVEKRQKSRADKKTKWWQVEQKVKDTLGRLLCPKLLIKEYVHSALCWDRLRLLMPERKGQEICWLLIPQMLRVMRDRGEGRCKPN